MRPDEGDPAVEVLPLGRERLGEVGAVFAASHRRYPTFTHDFPDPARRAAALRAFSTATVRGALAFYRRLGFEVEHDALPLAPDGPTSWGMRRAPRS